MADDLLKNLQGLATQGTRGTGMAASQRLLEVAKGVRGQDTNVLAAIVGGGLRGKALKASEQEQAIAEVEAQFKRTQEVAAERRAIAEAKQKAKKIASDEIKAAAPAIASEWSGAIAAQRQGQEINTTEIAQRFGNMFSDITGGEVVGARFMTGNMENLIMTMANGSTQVESITGLLADMQGAGQDINPILQQLNLNPKLTEAQMTKNAVTGLGGTAEQAQAAGLAEAAGVKIQDTAKGASEAFDVKSAEAKGKVSGVVVADTLVDFLEDVVFDESGELQRGTLAATALPDTFVGLSDQFLGTEAGIAKSGFLQTLNSIFRMESGAAVPEPEVTRYLAMYMPNATDTKRTAKFKLGMMKSRLSSMRAMFDNNVDLNTTLEQQEAMLSGLFARQVVQDMSIMRKADKHSKFVEAALAEGKTQEEIEEFLKGVK
jgi:hypothetical protein